MANTPAKQAPTELVRLEIVDWDGPIVEIHFVRPLVSVEDVDRLVAEAEAFVKAHIAPWEDGKAYFLTCYDNFSVPKQLAQRLQDLFVGFNRRYSKGDVRYGGTLVAKTLVISTAIRSESASEIYATREEALDHLRKRIRGRVAGAPIDRTRR